MNHVQRLRIRFAFLGILAAALIVVASLYSIQIKNSSLYKARAAAQYGKPIDNQYDRGTIYFVGKDGTRIAAATIDYGNTIAINPKLVTNPDQTYTALTQYVKVDKTSFDTAVSSAATYKELLNKVDDTTAQSVTALGLKGVTVSRESWRSYPGGTLAAHILGLVGEDQSTTTIQGKYGLERSYQEVLERNDDSGGAGLFAQFFSGAAGDSKSASEGDIVTTIEPTVQAYLEKILSDTLGVWHSDEIGGIVIDPQTGEIVAMSSLPTFNGNDTSTVKDASVFSNPLVEHAYEMGSIVKPLTMAIGLDTGAITPTSTYNDTGTMKLNNKIIANYDGRARGTTDMQTILSQSLNIGAATIALKVGADKMYTYFSNFGMGQKTGIDLPSEATGLISNLKSGRDIDVATASYGQGIALSPLSTARALSILANGGYVVTPHIVKEIDYTDGSKKIIDAPKTGPVLKPDSTAEVTKMLIKVVDTALKNGAIKEEHYTIAAKTGTAQIADHINGGYYKDRYLHSFFGYFPAYSPKYLVFLYQIYPKGAEYASATLTEPFDNMAKFLINYYDLPPDR